MTELDFPPEFDAWCYQAGVDAYETREALRRLVNPDRYFDRLDFEIRLEKIRVKNVQLIAGLQKLEKLAPDGIGPERHRRVMARYLRGLSPEYSRSAAPVFRPRSVKDPLRHHRLRAFRRTPRLPGVRSVGGNQS